MKPNTFLIIFNVLYFFNIEICLGQKEYLGERDAIDWVDIYQQPAFDHSLLKNHKIQMMPPQNIRPQSNTSEEPFISQTWSVIEDEDLDEKLLIKMKGRSLTNVTKAVAKHLPHEYAAVRVDEGKYYGTKFVATVWNPHVEHNELSLAQTRITAGPDDSLNAIKVGWVADGYKTFCYDQRCPGYVQLSRKVFSGAPLSPLSQYGSQNYTVWIAVFKAKGNWYLQVGEEVVGYWPANIFPFLKDSASSLQWGGEIINAGNEGRHTTTQMGSGHFGHDKFSKAALIYNLQVNTKEDDTNFEKPKAVYPVVTNGNCFSLVNAQYDENYQMSK